MGDIMTCKINADTTDGLKIVSDTSGAVDVQSNGTTRMTVLANGNVGIGASSPTTKLDIAGSILVDAYNNGGAGSGIFLRGGFLSTAQPSITVADHDGSAPDGISINGNDGVSFRTSNTERARIDVNGVLKFNSGFGSVGAAYGCRAWIKLTGTGTIGISASANVASITDRGTGTYTVTFTTAMPDANYSTQVTTTWATGVTEHVTGLVYHDSPYAQATGSVTAKTYNFSNAGAAIDASVVMLAVFR